MPDDPASDAPAPLRSDASRRRLAWHRIAILGGVGAFVALGVFWALALTGTLTPHNPDRLGDRTWARRAEAICKPVEDEIAKLPNAGAAKNAADRADALDRGTALLRGMVTKLRADLPESADGRRTVRAWLDDWHVYLEDRQAFSDNLRAKGGRAKPLFRSIHGSTAKETITDFAELNSISSCGAPLDL